MRSLHKVSATLLLVVLGLTVLAADRVMTPPPSAPLDAPAHQFSGERALQYAETMLIDDAPHYTGSPIQFEVRDRILAAFREMGHEPEVHRSFSHIFHERFSFMENIVVTLPGDPGERVIILTAHYDSVRASPTSMCDANGVGALMELARALAHHGPTAHTVVILLTDAEETGLQGAQAYADDHPEIVDRIIGVISVDRIGAGTASSMTERGPGSGWMERHLVAAAPRPVVSSVVASYLDTRPTRGGDYSVFFDDGLPGLHFGSYGRFYYHMPMENLEILDPHHLQEFGDKLMPAVLAMANDTTGFETRDRLVYGGVAGLFFLSWPEAWNLALTAGFGLLVAVAVVLLMRAGRLEARQILIGVGVWLGVVVLTGGAGVLYQMFGHRLTDSHEPYPANMHTLLAAGWFTPVAFCCLAAAVGRRFLQPLGALVGGLILLLAVAAAMTALLPGGTYLVIAPGVLAAAAVVAGFRLDDRRIALIAAALSGPLATMLVAQLLIAVHEISGLRDLMLPVAMIIVPLTTVLPLLLADARREAPVLSGVFGVLVASLLALTVVMPSYHEGHPVEMNILYVQDADADVAWWAIPHIEDRTAGVFGSLGLIDDGAIDRPYARWLSEWHFTRSSYPGFVSDAPRTNAAPPTAEILSSTARGDTIRVTMRLASPRGADEVGLLLPPDTRRTMVDVNGHARTYSGGGSDYWREYEVFAQGLGDITLTLEYLADEPVTAWVFDSDPILPGHADAVLAARPAWATKRHRGDRWMMFREVILGAP